jgi:hypothetical protein
LYEAVDRGTNDTHAKGPSKGGSKSLNFRGW